jgi:polysaccharide biosynthesis protein PelA
MLATAAFAAGPAGAGFAWAISYAADPSPEELQGLDLIVLDSDAHFSFSGFPFSNTGRSGTSVLAYLSLGEIERHRPYFEWAKSAGILLGENPNWHGSFYVDLRQEGWQRRVVEQLVPAMLAAGFNGVFLDTLDDAGAMERRDATRYRGMSGAATDLVRRLREAFPRIRIMVNRGYDLFPAIAPFVDILLGESVYTTYAAEHAGYVRVPAAQYQQQVGLLKQARAANPKLRLCSLDYWNPADRKGIRRIYRIERANGFAPYVATRKLDRVVKEP